MVRTYFIVNSLFCLSLVNVNESKATKIRTSELANIVTSLVCKTQQGIISNYSFPWMISRNIFFLYSCKVVKVYHNVTMNQNYIDTKN